MGQITPYTPQQREALVVPMGDVTNRLSAEDLAMIRDRKIVMEGVLPSEDRLWGFRAVASTNALDSYYTKPHVERALVPYAADLSSGRPVLQNHDYRSMSWGSSFDGRVADHEGKDTWFEGHKATKAVIGSYFILKNIEANGMKSNDVIDLARYGALNRTSVTFFPQRYECNICGLDMITWECEHWPGEKYDVGDGSGKTTREMCWAWIMDSRLLETSLVYANASPDSMLQRKIAEGIVQHEIKPMHALTLARRFGLPEPTAFRLAYTDEQEKFGKKGGKGMEDKSKREPGEEGKTDEQIAAEKKAADDAKVAADAKAAEDAAKAAADKKTADDAAAVAAAEAAKRGEEGKEPKPGEQKTDVSDRTTREQALTAILSLADKDEVGEYAKKIEDRASSIGVRLPGHAALEDFKTKAGEATGKPAGVDLLAHLTQVAKDAKTGTTLFTELVDRVVAAQISAGLLSAERAASYKQHLLEAKDVSFATDQLAIAEDARKQRWTAGRKVGDTEVEEEAAERKSPVVDDSNVFESLAPTKSTPSAYKVPAKT